MVRGLCPRDMIRGAVDGGGCAVSNVGAIGHAKRLPPTHPGGHTTAGRRGRRPLRAGGKPRYQHRGKHMRKGGNLRPPLGSPERGAVAARSAVTEGLGRRGCDAITSSVNPRRAGVEARPYGVWGRCQRVTDVVRRPTAGGRGGRLARGTGVVGHPANGAPRTVRPTTCGKVST